MPRTANPSKRTLALEPIVISELKRQSVPIPPDLILRVIQVESQGVAGLVNPKSGASGLMQVMPGTLEDFNARNGRAYPISDMRGQTPEQVRRQIEVGIAVLAHYWKEAYEYLSGRKTDVPIDDLAKIADVYYAAGAGYTEPKLNKLPDPTWPALAAKYPNFNALPHQVKIFSAELPPLAWNLPAIENWVVLPQKKKGKITQDPKKGFAIGILILIAAYWAMYKKGKPA